MQTLKVYLWHNCFKSLFRVLILAVCCLILYLSLEINGLYSQLTSVLLFTKQQNTQKLNQQYDQLKHYAHFLKDHLLQNSNYLYNPSMLIDFSEFNNIHYVIKTNYNKTLYSSDNTSSTLSTSNISNTPYALGFFHFNHKLYYTLQLTPATTLTVVQTLDQQLQNITQTLNYTYRRSIEIQLPFYIIAFTIFILLCSCFFWYARRIVAKLTIKLDKNLHMLLNTQLTNEIQEFDIVSTRLNTYIQELKDKTDFVSLILDNIHSGIIVKDQANNIILHNKTADKILKKYNFKLIAGRITIQEQRFNIIHLHFEHTSQQQSLFIINNITHEIVQQKQIAWQEVARVIAHEVKNPLTPTRLCIEKLSSNSLTSENKSKYIKIALDNIDHINHLISGLTLLTKPITAIKTHFNIITLFQNIINTQQLIYSHITFQLNIPEHITTYQVHADKTLIKQMIINLLQNSAQACETTLIKHITVTLACNTDHIFSFTITDTGIGLKLPKNKLFQPYVTTKQYGTGLGLYIIKRILQEHSGHIEFNDQITHGCECIVRFITESSNNHIN